MNSIDDLLKNSIRQYENLINVASSLSDNLVSLSPAVILTQCQQLSALQKKQRILDDFIIEVIADSGPQVLSSPNIGNYQRILGKASSLCDAVTVKVKARKYQLKREINTLE
ncbi:MAG TPA: hypothetical protein EYP35_01875 [Desulfobacterales bacterium]|nr:hypothetical protein [Desulfobacterales bacterium]HIP38886.1 hypothetical protein [Desulfocapsa sulfexigens]